MHKSRIAGFVLDCKGGDIDAGARFWSAVLGRKVAPADADSPTYRGLEVRDDEPQVLLQTVKHDSRIHMDIETDDVDAEAERLVALGAKKVEKVKTWWVLEAPTGHRFCVVRLQRGPLGKDANEWP
jgi:hypothetical protein